MAFDRISKFYKQNFRFILLAVIACLVALAWWQRFVLDDAFISFRYADNLARGWGLVWNEGERVEGYTNFLWTLLMAVPIALGLSPVSFSMALGLLSFVASLYFTYRLALLVLSSKTGALVTIIMLGTNYTFSRYATSGMETQLQACLFVTTLYALASAQRSGLWTNRRFLGISLLLSLALLTRLDSALLFAIVFPAALLPVLKEKIEGERKAMKVACLCAPLAALVGGWMLWKLYYYGDILPNTFYAKISSLSSYIDGLNYVYYFFRYYWLLPLFLIPVITPRRFSQKFSYGLLISLSVTILWLLYVIKVGGDFMEFRFIVPIMPLIFVILGWMVFSLLRNPILQSACIALVIAGSVYHGKTFTLTGGVEPIEGLAGHVSGSECWEDAGKALGKALNYDSRVTIAVSPAGAIPFYSRLTTIDMLGLNDRWIARNGAVVGERIGHQRMATVQYLLDRRVNLLLGPAYPMSHEVRAPIFGDVPSALNNFFLPTDQRQYDIPKTSKLIEIPISNELKLPVMYLFPSAIVDEAIEREGWRTYPLVASDTDPATWPEDFPFYKLGTKIAFADEQAGRYIWAGWSVREPFGRWSDAERAMIIFALNEDEILDSVLRIKLWTFTAPGKLNAQHVTVSLNGRELTTWQLSNPDMEEFTLDIPRDALSERNVLSFYMPDIVSPKSIGVSPNETRRLGVYVEWVEIDAQR
ncbi:MAG: hypothetical protein AUG51_05485 [Acidobacteria bacterium 13_1_20CM_3_53_8]|nr:MAG: hypothetical protein AUG51_05485 [Acidobacteria bacterium 13_1_20CM_3_53_8]